MTSLLILALPVVVYLSLCALPRAAGTLYTVGIMFLLAQGARWLGLLGDGGSAIIGFAQVGIVLAGLVQGLRLLALPSGTSQNRYYALVFGGALLGAALLRNSFGA